MKTRYRMLLLPPLLAACATLPTGPTVAVMPAQGKPFDVFAQEEQQCRAYAAGSIGGDSNQAANASLAGNMALGTVAGAAAGALIGGNHQGAGSAPASACWPAPRRRLQRRLRRLRFPNPLQHRLLAVHVREGQSAARPVSGAARLSAAAAALLIQYGRNKRQQKPFNILKQKENFRKHLRSNWH
ncbi:Uncharacterised protein [Chromobacterium violaceum]|uniref:Glycine zipper domain-containing protein n=1 Tax=Chromobacterium violaceum TaxID=536 RepID=A0A3S4LDT3_CHRVL|nr:Uncharacterised protein [Chromobacterium violaceum]